jgi:hypothetical protein
MRRRGSATWGRHPMWRSDHGSELEAGAVGLARPGIELALVPRLQGPPGPGKAR